MNRLPYTSVAALYDPDPAVHRARAAEVGLRCPEDVFGQLFHAPRLDPLLLVAVAPIDWLTVTWREAELSGAALAQVGIPRGYEASVQAVRRAVLQAEASDPQPEGLTAWGSAATWPRPPVLVEGDLTGSEASYLLLIGRARLGALIGRMERRDVPPDRRHRVVIGSRR